MVSLEALKKIQYRNGQPKPAEKLFLTSRNTTLLTLLLSFTTTLKWADMSRFESIVLEEGNNTKIKLTVLTRLARSVLLMMYFVIYRQHGTGHCATQQPVPLGS